MASAGPRSVARIVEHEVMEAQLARNLARGGEEADEQLAELLGLHAVEIVLALAARLNQPRDAEERKVMADGWLALAEPVAEIGHVELAVLSEVEEDPETGLVTQELEDLGELTHHRVGDLGRRVRGANRVGGGFQ